MNADDLPSSGELAELLPQYRFEELIAEGGMGAVYRAEQISLGRPVAIKILPRSFSADAGYREQFKSEARLMGALTHPHIVDIHDFGEAGGVLYIVMELLEGTNLYQRMRQEPLKQAEVVKILTQVCDALSAAHQKGVVHRDVKPENIFLESGLRVKLGDFGIARLRRPGTDGDGDAAAADAAGRLGTPEYAAPELFDIERTIDHRADIFSLGVVLYEMLTGGRPTGTFIAPSQRRAGVDKRFDEVVIRAMQNEPQDRYASPEEMKKDVLKVLQAGAAAVRVPESRTPTGRRLAAPAASAGGKKAPGAAPPAAPAGNDARRMWLWGGIAAAASFSIVAAIMLARGDGNSAGRPAETPGRDTAVSSVPANTAPPLEAPPANPNGSERIADSRPPERPRRPAPPAPSESPPPPPEVTPGEGGAADRFVFNGHTYQFISTRLSWTEAKAEAERQGGYLACVTSQAEYDALRALLLPRLQRDLDCCWLGASDAESEGTWKWINGESFTFHVWAADAPNDAGRHQNYLAWQRQDKYGAREIDWNDLNNHVGARSVSGLLIEWDRVLENAPAGPAVTSIPASAATPSSALPQPPVPAVKDSTQWQPLVWKASDPGSLRGRVEIRDGWYVFASGGGGTLETPAGVVPSDAAVRVRLRVDADARVLQFKPRYGGDEQHLICALAAPGVFKIFRRENGNSDVLAEWKIAERLQPGDEIRATMILSGRQVTMLFNGNAAGSIDTGAPSSGQALRIYGDGVAIRDAEWLPLAGVSDAAKAVAAAKPGWSASESIASETAAFSQKRETVYAAKLNAALQSLRDSYARRLRTLSGQKPADAGVYNAEAELVTAGTDPPAPDAPGSPSLLTALRKTYHDAKAGIEKPFAAAALTLWQERLTKLTEMETALRQSRKLADAAEIAPLRSMAEVEVARFSALAPPRTARPGTEAVTASPFPLKRPAMAGRVVAWRRTSDVTHDKGAGEIPSDVGPVVAIASGPGYALALRPDGGVVQWGTAFAGHVDPPAGLTDVVAIDAGQRICAALRSDGTIMTWGPELARSVGPAGVKPAVAMSVGSTQGHALHADGTISYFGFSNEQGTPFAVPANLSGVKALDCGFHVTTVLKSDGSLEFIGSNDGGQITQMPPKLKSVSLIACGDSICAALSGGHTIHFWGKRVNDPVTELRDGSVRFAATQLCAAGHSHCIAARNAAGDWKFFGRPDTIDVRLAAKNAKGAIDVKFSKDHILALMPMNGKHR